MNIRAFINKKKSEFNLLSEQIKDLVYPLSDRQLNWRPQYDAWSILECISHLNETGQMYLNGINNVMRKTPRKTSGIDYGLKLSLKAKLSIYMMKPPYRFKMRTMKQFRPGDTSHKEEILLGFINIQTDFINILDQSAFHHLQKVKFYSPVSRKIKFNFYEVVSFILAHERRHIWQAEQNVAHPNFPYE